MILWRAFFLSQSLNMVMQNQGRCELLSILKCKPLYLIIALALVGYEFTLHSTAPR